MPLFKSHLKKIIVFKEILKTRFLSHKGRKNKAKNFRKKHSIALISDAKD